MVYTRFAIRFIFVICTLTISLFLKAQKKPLDHTVYDSWQTIGERKLSADGSWIVYTIDLQEGDGTCVLQRIDSSFKIEIPRGYQSAFSEDSRFLIIKIKPLFSDLRQAKIKKKKVEEFPKDSLGIYDLTSNVFQKIPNVISYSLPKKSGKSIAYLIAPIHSDSSRGNANLDSSHHIADSLKSSLPIIIEQIPDKKQKRKMSASGERLDDAIDDSTEEPNTPAIKEGNELVVENLSTHVQKKFPLINEYLWSENGKLIVLKSSAKKSDKSVQPLVYVWRTVENSVDTLMKGANDIKSLSIDHDGYQIAFIAERDSSFKSLQKFYKLWYWQNGDHEASVLVDKFSEGMLINWTVSDEFLPVFSKSGNRIYLGTNPIKSIIDTNLIEIDKVKLDIWHYNDDYLQTYQLKNIEKENKRSYLAMVDLQEKKFVQLADLDLPEVVYSSEADASQLLGITDRSNRIEMQWQGDTKKDVYSVNASTGNRKLIKKNLEGDPQISPFGNYIYWYDLQQKHYFAYTNDKVVNISSHMPHKLYDEEYDMPSQPTPYGIMAWGNLDSSIYIYDRFDIWKLDPTGIKLPIDITNGMGRKSKTNYKYLSTNPDDKTVTFNQKILLRSFNEKSKQSGLSSVALNNPATLTHHLKGDFSLGAVIKSKQADFYAYTKESFTSSPDLYVSKNLNKDVKLTAINPQQSNYTWGTAELYSWKAYNGKMAQGILYKPDNFQEGKKYPLITYFYEKLSDGLNNYIPPAPTPSRLNIPFFVSRGYMVLAPDIHYEIGYPGKGAVDYVVSGARSLVKKGWVDSTRMGIQGQSWGGYQVAHIITRTTVFKAAWAGAPVANMTSAYGGIRWESGMNRQFQYEKTQSRIGTTLWQNQRLYIENSPLFHLPKVTTPLVIMANDNDGAVPWYQGIELFTAMRRLNKKVWMLNYNGEAHNLVERKNRKDIQIREQQFFDWLLKGDNPPTWISVGVPAVEKGKTMGLDK